MTKQIRIENADTSANPVRITIQNKNLETGEWVDQPCPVQLDRPTAMVEKYIHSTQRIVIEERAADAPAST